VRAAAVWVLGSMAMAAVPFAAAQSANMTLPESVIAGSAFSIPTSGSGKATLYIVGPGQALRRDLMKGESASFPAGTLYNAGHYVAILTGETSTDTGEFDVAPAPRAEALGFLAQPSRLPVDTPKGISGTIYVFEQ
jgi:hypothetical protein